MRVKLLVQTQEFQSWPAKDGRPASTSHNLVCVDMSQPADARMTESISYRLKDDEIPKYWDKAMDKIIEVNLRRIAQRRGRTEQPARARRTYPRLHAEPATRPAIPINPRAERIRRRPGERLERRLLQVR